MLLRYAILGVRSPSITGFHLYSGLRYTVRKPPNVPQLVQAYVWSHCCPILTQSTVGWVRPFPTFR
jgi:hypothetical protein